MSCRYARPGIAPCPRVIAQEEWPWYIQQIRRGLTVKYTRIAEELPAEAVLVARRYVRSVGMKSHLSVPIETGSAAICELAISTNAVRTRTWPDNLIARLRVVGEIFAQALARKEMERALRQSEQRYRSVVEDQSDLICRYLPDTTLTFVNDAYCRFWRKTREELIGTKFLDLIPEPARAAARQHVESVIAHPREERNEHQVLMPDGTIGWQQWIDRAIVGTDGRIVELQGIGRDLTEQRAAEDALRQARAEVAHAWRLSALGELSASIAHELGQPLTAILSNAQAGVHLVAQEPPPIAELKEILTDIAKDDERAGEIIRRMSELIRKRELETQPVDVNVLVADTLRLVTSDAAERQIHISTELAPDLPIVQGDRVHLQQVVLNLLLNAMEALAAVPPTDRRITVRSLVRDGRLHVAVTDSGRGIPPDLLSGVFEPFQTTKSNGLGIGLSIARGIIETHGGRISAENGAHGGAIVGFNLPIVSPAGSRPGERSAPPRQRTSSPWPSASV